MTSSRTGSHIGARGPDGGWWQRLPLDRVTCIYGATPRSLAEAVDPLPGGAPAVTFYTVRPDRASAAPDIVADVVDALERAAVDLISLWLPQAEPFGGASSFEGISTLDRRAAVQRALHLGADSAHFGPYLAALAETATSGRSTRLRTFALETRASGAARTVAAAYRRSDCSLVLEAPAQHGLSVVETAAEWLSAQGGFGVWLTGAGTASIDRFPSVRVRAPAVADDVATVVDRIRPLSYPPVEGHPHPGSAPEKILHEMLGRHAWASGRKHNRTVRLGDLSEQFTVDIHWPVEQVVVEIDGVEHRGAALFARDRMRDNELQIYGNIVLRFTNAQVVADPHRVVAIIRRVVTARRSKGIHR